VVDATDETQVEGWFDHLAKQADGLDIVFNAVGPRAAAAGYATPSTRLPVDTFLLPLMLIVGSQFLTARVAARRMAAQGRGAIVTLSASLSGGFVPFMAGITAACVEAMSRSLAAEFGPDGVRLNCVRAGGMPETRTIRETLALMARERGTTPGEADARTMSTVLGRPVRLDKAAAAVAWLASDAASGVAGRGSYRCRRADRSRARTPSTCDRRQCGAPSRRPSISRRLSSSSSRHRRASREDAWLPPPWPRTG